MRKLSKVIIAACCFCLSPLSAWANTGVVLNEIAWMGTTEGWQNEWIELHNPASQEIDITGWKIDNGGAKNETLVMPAGRIGTNGYFLICRKGIGDCDLVESKMSLHNEYNKNGALVLKSAQGNTIDATPEASEKEWPGGDNETKQTMERKNLTDWPASNASRSDAGWQTSAEPGGTPKAPNSQSPILTPTTTPNSNPPIPLSAEDSSLEPPVTESATTTMPGVEPQIIGVIEYPKNIFINEILPSPEGADTEEEWIELYNDNDFEVSLNSWQLKDKVGQGRTYTCPTNSKIAPHGFLFLPRTETKITLQNSGDTLELLNPNNEIAHQVNYPKAPIGQSYNRTSADWQWSTVLTPEKENIISQPSPSQSSPGESWMGKTTQKTGTKNQGPTSTVLAAANIQKELPASSTRLLTLLLAVIIAIGSVIIVLFLKKNPSSQ